MIDNKKQGIDSPNSNNSENYDIESDLRQVSAIVTNQNSLVFELGANYERELTVDTMPSAVSFEIADEEVKSRKMIRPFYSKSKKIVEKEKGLTQVLEEMKDPVLLRSTFGEFILSFNLIRYSDLSSETTPTGFLLSNELIAFATS